MTIVITKDILQRITQNNKPKFFQDLKVNIAFKIA